MILSYIDNDPFTILNLMLVSKVWYLTFTCGRNAEDNWMRRCHAMAGITRKVGQCKTWRESYIKLLHGRCIHCFKPTSPVNNSHIGRLLFEGYTFIVTCSECSRQVCAGPLVAISEETAMKDYKVKKDQLQKLRHQSPTWNYLRGNGGSKRYLRAAVEQLAWRNMAREALLQKITSCASETDDGAYLKMAIDLASKPSARLLPCPTVLARLVVKHIPYMDDDDGSLRERIVEVMRHICAVLLEIGDQLASNEKSSLLYPRLEDRVTLEDIKMNWIDAFMEEKVTAKDYVDACRAVELKHEQEEEMKLKRQEEEKKEKLRRQEEEKELKMRRLAMKEIVMDAARRCGCGNTNAKDCQYGLCGGCCAGPDCKRHRR